MLFTKHRVANKDQCWFDCIEVSGKYTGNCLTVDLVPSHLQELNVGPLDFNFLLPDPTYLFKSNNKIFAFVFIFQPLLVSVIFAFLGAGSISLGCVAYLEEFCSTYAWLCLRFNGLRFWRTWNWKRVVLRDKTWEIDGWRLVSNHGLEKDKKCFSLGKSEGMEAQQDDCPWVAKKTNNVGTDLLMLIGGGQGKLMLRGEDN